MASVFCIFTYCLWDIFPPEKPNHLYLSMLDHSILKKHQKRGNSREAKFVNEVLQDLWICLVSRETSLLGRKEVLTGKAKFGILGDGKEVPQVAMARYFKKGDFRSGYYRDQTFMFAIGESSVQDFFAQLYADPEGDPFSGGRQMNAHFATKMIDEQDNFVKVTDSYNVTSDISSTGGQMGRALGIALASAKYRAIPDLQKNNKFSNNGNEVSFCTIGDASTSEGAFWETMNAASVMQVPLAVSVWDDGYGISVPIELQTIKGSISRGLEGFLQDEHGNGIMIYTAKGWDYAELCSTYERAISKSRKTHQPCVIHVKELTQPQGHSTSGSHERYKDADRLKWEKEHDCIEKMIEWILEIDLLSESSVDALRKEAKEYVKQAKNEAWVAYNVVNKKLVQQVAEAIQKSEYKTGDNPKVDKYISELNNIASPSYSEVVTILRRVLLVTGEELSQLSSGIRAILNSTEEQAEKWYGTNLYSETEKSALRQEVIPAIFPEEATYVTGYKLLNNFFDAKLSSIPELFAFGEDVGYIGDVNQGFAGMQEKYGKDRVFDTGIREWTIIGQAIGMAMRGLRPISEIQYLDYINYAFSPLTDDLATLRFRSAGLQAAPVIVRTRGHRLEGIWHAGSPMGMLVNSMKGIYICTPRNMTQAAGMYNTLLASMDPAIVIECLNGYRLKEELPTNLAEFNVPLGVPEVLQKGNDITLVTYGSCVRVAQEGIAMLSDKGISVELIDVQTLIPFDVEGLIAASLSKTNRILFLDEDVPGGGTAYMMQNVLERDGGYYHLDAKPITLSAKDYRTPFGSVGDYFCKPNAEDVAEKLLELYKL